MADTLSNIQVVDIKLTTASGIEKDITQTFLLINFYQSLLLKKFISGRIVFADTSDFLSNFPIIGGEKIVLTLQNTYDSSFINYNFRIYKVDRDMNTFHGIQKIKLLNVYLCSDEEYNNYTKISKRYTGLPNDIISELLSDNLITPKSFDYDATTEEIDFVSNFWTVEQCIDYICNNSKSSTQFDYIFYENSNGYHFKSLSNLFKQSPVSTLSFDLSSEQFTNIDNILRYQFNSYFDDLQWRKKGIFGSSGYRLDFDEYIINFTSDTIQDIDESIYHNGANRMYNSDTDILNRVYATYDDDEIELVRTTHLNLLNRYNFVVQLTGDIGKNVGDIYTINFPSLDNESASGSDSFSGQWLATEINTTIQQNNDIKQNITFTRNSLFNNTKLDKY